jgi:hypothetical protein
MTMPDDDTAAEAAARALARRLVDVLDAVEVLREARDSADDDLACVIDHDIPGLVWACQTLENLLSGNYTPRGDTP